MGATEDFERGRALMKKGNAFEALPHIQRAYDADPDNPLYRSTYAVLHAQQRGMAQEALVLCRSAIIDAPHEPQHYVHLAQIERKAGNQQGAVEAVRAGLRVDGEHAELLRWIGKLGLRRRPIFPCLPRSHFLNKYLGMLTWRFGMR